MTAAAGSRVPLKMGLAIIVASFILDQATKLAILYLTDLAAGGSIPIAPFLDFVLVWNPGISYGLFAQETAFGRWALVAITVGAVIGLSYWLRQADSRFTAIGLALVIGGAAGNLVDRLVFGAVVDFIYLHVAGYSWYVFNLADTWIVAGVAALLYDSFRPQRPSGTTGSA